MIAPATLGLMLSACSTAYVNDCQPADVLMGSASVLPEVSAPLTERGLLDDDLGVRRAYVDLRERNRALQDHVRKFCQKR